MLERALGGLQEGTGFSRWKGLSLTSALWDRGLVLTVSWLLIYMIKDVLRKDSLKAQAHHWQKKKHSFLTMAIVFVSALLFMWNFLEKHKKNDNLDRMLHKIVGFYSFSDHLLHETYGQWGLKRNIWSMHLFGSKQLFFFTRFSHWMHFVFIDSSTQQTLNKCYKSLAKRSRGSVCSQQGYRTLANTAYESTWEHTHIAILSLFFSVKAWQVQIPVYNRAEIKEVL